ncbi:hypothetical protein Cyan10605_2852 [Cyanobacterium aponinum PCC 10605]|uniref:Uncharacterized protein n=3 Tax=Cyanobacterium aponinum TaxID=379064 RepID=K9Z702_CYAAP|nr:hypothetical protein Cyan10605_2852 [Cyanobacterium aponinum PCC 10605]
MPLRVEYIQSLHYLLPLTHFLSMIPKIVNPLNYPLAVFVAGVCLFFGVRFANVSSFLMLPISISVGVIGSGFLANNSLNNDNKINLDNRALEEELELAKQESNLLIKKAENLRLEAKNLLHDAHQMDLLTAIEYGCDRTFELPEKIEYLSKKLSGSDSLLSEEELEEKLKTNLKKQQSANGLALKQLRQIESNLRRNIDLAKQGKSAREAQVFALTNILTESAGVLQQLQNKLRTSDLTNSQALQDLQDLTQELSSLLTMNNE